MSTNLYLCGRRDITINKTGNIERQETYYKCWQTPTDVTHRILNSIDVYSTYIDWVLNISRDYPESVFADDDIFCEREPIDTKIVNDGKVHLEQLNSWMTSSIESGYELEWYSL